MVRLIDFLRKHIVQVKLLFFAFLIFTVIFDFFAVRHEPHFWGDTIIGFWGFFGFMGALLLAAVCKGIYHVWLMKEEDYYDR